MISFIESFIKEIEMEAIGTRKMLSLVPSDKMDWQPHPKSMTMKVLATHIADIPRWVSLAVTTDVLDFATSPYEPADCNNAEDLLKYYNENIGKAIEDLAQTKTDILEETWTLRSGEMIFMQLTRLETIRHSFCQQVHHRAQLGVNLRLLDIPIPGVYGPSADEAGK